MSPKALYQSESCHRKLKRSVIPAALLCAASSSTLRERPLCHPHCGSHSTLLGKVSQQKRCVPVSKRFFLVSPPPHETSSRPKLKRSVNPGLPEEQLLFSLVPQIPTCVSGLFSVSTRVHWEKSKKVSMEKLVGCFLKGRKGGLSLSSTDGHSY